MAKCTVVLFVVFLLASIVPRTLGAQTNSVVTGAVGQMAANLFFKEQMKQMNDMKDKLAVGKKDLITTWDNARKKATTAVTSTLNNVMDVVDGSALRTLLPLKFPKLATDTKQTHCVERMAGYKKDVGAILLGNGKLINFEPIKILPPTLKEDYGTSESFEIPFELSDLTMEYYWSFRSENPLVNPDRRGTIGIVQPGPNYVKVKASVAKSQTDLKLLLNNNRCFLLVQGIEMQFGENPKSTGVFYNSAFKDATGVTFTGGVIKKFVEGHPELVQEQVGKALKHIMEPTLRTKDVFCESALTKAESMKCVLASDKVDQKNTNQGEPTKLIPIE